MPPEKCALWTRREKGHEVPVVMLLFSVKDKCGEAIRIFQRVAGASYLGKILPKLLRRGYIPGAIQLIIH